MINRDYTEVSLKDLIEGDTGIFKAEHWLQFQHYHVVGVSKTHIHLKKRFDSTSKVSDYRLPLKLSDKYIMKIHSFKALPPISLFGYDKSGNNYILKEDYMYIGKVKPLFEIRHKYFTIYPDGVVIIRKGYLWDGATGIPDTDKNLRASCVHDVYCQAMSLGLLEMKFRPYSDETFCDICVEDGMSRFVADIHYLGLRIYGNIIYGY